TSIAGHAAVSGTLSVAHWAEQAPVAQGIEHRPPEAGAQVRILPGAPPHPARTRVPVHPYAGSRPPVRGFPSTRTRLPVHPYAGSRPPVRGFPSTRTRVPVHPYAGSRPPVRGFPSTRTRVAANPSRQWHIRRGSQPFTR